MLERLIISNLAVIEELEVEFSPGLTVLTGETGAGKSIIVDALTLLIGEKASVEMLRTGAEKALVQGVFTYEKDSPTAVLLRELGLEEEQELIISREITSNRSFCRVNGRAVNQNTLKALGANLVDMHGQHQHQSLLQTGAHLHLIDSYGGQHAERLISEIRQCVQDYRRCEKDISDLSGDERERARLVDLLEFQIDEIEKTELLPGEDENTRQERDQLLHFGKVSAAVENAYEILYAGQMREKAVVDLLGKTTSGLRDILRFCPDLTAAVELLEQAVFLVQDASRELAGLRENLTHEPDRLDQLERRLDIINRLKAKYGDTIEQILAFREEAAVSLERIHGSRERIDYLQREQRRAREKYETLATELSAMRLKLGTELAQQAQANLQELGLKGARLSLRVTERQGDIHSLGREEIEFLFSANTGEDLRPLQKIASGGEISRVMLSLKAVLAQVDPIPTQIFDEIDSGVGGRTAYSVADKITEVARGRQVLCITHLPQIAAVADTHLFVAKTEEKGRTFTTVTPLYDDERVKEVARMLSGEVHDTALSHAREMLNRKTS